MRMGILSRDVFCPHISKVREKRASGHHKSPINKVSAYTLKIEAKQSTSIVPFRLFPLEESELSQQGLGNMYLSTVQIIW